MSERSGARRFTFVGEVPPGYEDAAWCVTPDGSVHMAKANMPPIWLPPSRGKWQAIPLWEVDGWPTRDAAAPEEDE